MRRVLFVDDEPHVLESLRDALRPWRRELRMSFVSDGRSALEELEREPYDAVVSDMRMPGMDGAALLREVRRLRPESVRIVLSGYAEMASVARAAVVAHRFLAKPCEVEELARVIQRSCDINALVEQAELRSTATGIGRLPSVPRLYSQLTSLTGDPNASAADASRLVEQDPAMTARVLQLANSAFFGRSRTVTDVADAIAYIGLNALKALALSADAIEAFQPTEEIEGFSIERLQSHSALVARITRRLIGSGAHADSAVTAALIHEIGILVLAARAPRYLGEVLACAEQEARPLFEVERDQRGFSHADVGAHVLGLWGLPPAIVEAVALHHGPIVEPEPGLGAITAVHVACALADGPAGRLDLEYLERVGLTHLLPEWQVVAEEESVR